jgi:plasmid maintenance system antidote protein VapI
MDLSQNALARAIHVSPRRINEIVLGRRAITADTDLRLARYFGLSEGFFLGFKPIAIRRRRNASSQANLRRSSRKRRGNTQRQNLTDFGSQKDIPGSMRMREFSWWRFRDHRPSLRPAGRLISGGSGRGCTRRV